MFKKFLIILILSIWLFSCNSNFSENKESDKIKITSSIIPISSIINYIWWEYVEVTNIVPAWVDLHDYDTKTQDAIKIENSDLVVYIWYDHFDWFLDKIVWWKKVLKLADYFEIDEEEDNSHVWFWKKNLLIISEKIFKKLGEIDPENGDFYNQNYIKFMDEIDKITKDFKSENDWKNPQKFIVYHDAYSYLLEDLWIWLENQIIFKSNHSADLSVKQMKDFQDNITNENIKIIFKEPQEENSSLEQIISENNLQVYDLDPLWKDESANWYIENLKENLESLAKIYE